MFNPKIFETPFIKEKKAEFIAREGKPFKYIVFDNLLERDFALKCQQEFYGALQESSTPFVSYSDPDFEFDKHALNKTELMPASLSQLFNALHSDQVVELFERLTGFDGLRVDVGRWGGGLHATKPGGYLAVHKDFSVLPSTFNESMQFVRTLNLIGYLTSESFTEDWGGQLELWDSEGKGSVEKVSPSFNRWVLFDTRGTYHGHPYPFKGAQARISIASYYYVESKTDPSTWKSTSYLKLPWREESEHYKQKREDRASAELRYKSFFNKK